MKGILSVVGFLILCGLGSPVLADADSFAGISPLLSQDMIGTVKTVNAKSECQAQDARPITVEAIGKDGQPLANVALTVGMRSPRDDTRLLPGSMDQVLNQEKNRLVLKTDQKGQIAVRLSKDAQAGEYPLLVQTSNQEFDLDAVCKGQRVGYTKQILWILVGIELFLLLFALLRMLLARRSEEVLIVGDLHGSQLAYDFVVQRLEKKRYHAVIMTGNLVNNTTNALTYAQSFIDMVQKQHKTPLFLIHGDSESAAVIQLYQQSGRSVHLNPIRFSQYTIYGLGGIDARVPELSLPKHGKTIFVSRIPSPPQGGRAPFIQITGHTQSAFNRSKRGPTVTIDAPPAIFGQALVLSLPQRTVGSMQAPIATSIASPSAQAGKLAWR